MLWLMITTLENTEAPLAVCRKWSDRRARPAHLKCSSRFLCAGGLTFTSLCNALSKIVPPSALGYVAR